MVDKPHRRTAPTPPGANPEIGNGSAVGGDAGIDQMKSAGIHIDQLTVRAGSRRLLVKASAYIPEGKITVLVGPSGVGKSVLLRIVAGLLPPDGPEAVQYDGSVTWRNRPLRPGDLGVVFQSFALFDELSPRANVQFARDHRRNTRIAAQPSDQLEALEPAALMEELRIPHDVPTSRLSGGQRQRLAIARALAFHPAGVLFDEPTSGLDPATGQQVAQLIRSTHEHFGKTTVVVTHDFATLIPIADRVLVLDPAEQQLVEVPPNEWEQLEDRLRPLAQHATTKQEEAVGGAAPWWKWAQDFLTGTTRCVEAAANGLFRCIPIWRNWKWGLRYQAHYLRLVMGPTAWFYLLMAGIIVGYVTTHFTFQFLPFARYTEPLLEDDLLLSIGFALYRIFVPIIATVLIAARCGAAVTSDIAAKQYGNQNDALRTFGAAPDSYLLTPVMISFLIGTPVLTILAFFAAKYTSLLSFVISHPNHGAYLWDTHFHRGLRQLGQTFYNGSHWLLFKLVCCGFGTAIISYSRGMRPKHSTSDISNSVTATILWSTLYVLLVHFVFAFFEFNKIE